MNYASWLIWILPLAAAPVALLVARFRARAADWYTVAIAAVVAILGLYQAATFTSPHTEGLSTWVAQLNLTLQVYADATSVLLSAFVSVVSFFIVLYSVGYMRHDGGKGRYNMLVLLFVGGMLGLVMAGNLIQLYFFWEIVGICSALLIAFYFEKPEARHGGMKAFVMTRVGDASLLVSILIIFSSIHTTQFSAIFSAAGTSSLGGNTLTLAAILLVIGAMGKSAQVPLHTWLPDAMEAPTPVTALIHAATMVNAGVYLMIRMFPLLHASEDVVYAVLGIGLITAMVGGLGALVERDFKRIFAYSTISQLGFMFTAVGLSAPVMALYLLIGHGFFKALIFLSVGSVVESVGTRDIGRMGGLARPMPYTYSVFLVSMLAMGGLPPLVGFWSKGAITSSAMDMSIWIWVVVVLASLLTSLYSFRSLLRVFHGQSRAEKPVSESPAIMVVPMLLLAGFVAFSWIPLNSQPLLPFYAASVNWLETAVEEIAILVAGFAAVLLAIVLRAAQTAGAVSGGGLVAKADRFIVSGMGFDSAYNAFARRVKGAGGEASKVQSGSFGLNILLMLVLFGVVLVLATFGVI